MDRSSNIILKKLDREEVKWCCAEGRRSKMLTLRCFRRSEKPNADFTQCFRRSKKPKVFFTLCFLRSEKPNCDFGQCFRRSKKPNVDFTSCFLWSERPNVNFTRCFRRREQPNVGFTLCILRKWSIWRHLGRPGPERPYFSKTAGCQKPYKILCKMLPQTQFQASGGPATVFEVPGESAQWRR